MKPSAEAAVRAGNDVLATYQLCETRDALCHELWVLDDVGSVTDYPGNQNLSWRQLNLLPHAPLVLVTRIGGFNQIGSGADL